MSHSLRELLWLNEVHLKLVMHWPQWWQGLPLQAFGAAFVDVSQPFFPAQLHCCHWFCLLPQPPASNKRLGAHSGTPQVLGQNRFKRTFLVDVVLAVQGPICAMYIIAHQRTVCKPKKRVAQRNWSPGNTLSCLNWSQTRGMLRTNGNNWQDTIFYTDLLRQRARLMSPPMNPMHVYCNNRFSSWNSGSFDHAILSVAQGYSACAATLSTCILAANLGVLKRGTGVGWCGSKIHWTTNRKAISVSWVLYGFVSILSTMLDDCDDIVYSSDTCCVQR